MTCRKPGGCGHEFCWLCMGNWSNHQECNSVTDGAAVRNARNDIQRYAFCWERFVNQEAAQKITARELQEKAAAIVAAFTADNVYGLKDMEFLPQAVTQIYRCR